MATRLHLWLNSGRNRARLYRLIFYRPWHGSTEGIAFAKGDRTPDYARASCSVFVLTPLRCFGNSEVLHLSSFRDKVVSPSFPDNRITVEQRLKNRDIVSAGILSLVINHRVLIIITISQKYLRYCLGKNKLFTCPALFTKNLRTEIPVEKNRIVDRSCFDENRNWFVHRVIVCAFVCYRIEEQCRVTIIDIFLFRKTLYRFSINTYK